MRQLRVFHARHRAGVPGVPGNGSMMTSLLPIGARVLLEVQDTVAGMIL
jgi:hypothetical protein